MSSILQSPPSTPKNQGTSKICPSAPKRRRIEPITLKSGDVKRFFLNLEEVEKDDGDVYSALENMYYVLEFSIGAKENEECNLEALQEISTLISDCMYEFRRSHEDEKNETERMMNVALEVIPKIRTKFQNILRFAQIEESY